MTDMYSMVYTAWCTVHFFSPCSPERRWSVGSGEGRSSLERQEGVPAYVVRGKEEEGGG